MENKDLITIDGQSYRKSDIKAKVSPVLIVKVGNVFRRRGVNPAYAEICVLAQVNSNEHKLININSANRQTDTHYPHTPFHIGKSFGEVAVDDEFHRSWERVAPSLKAYFNGVK